MPCTPTGSLLISVVGGVLPLFYVGTERESSPGETALQLFSADAPNVRLSRRTPWFSCVTLRTAIILFDQDLINVFWSLRHRLISPLREAA